MARATVEQKFHVQANTVRAIAADEGTAICFDSHEVAQLFGAGSAFFSTEMVSPIPSIGFIIPAPWARKSYGAIPLTVVLI